MWTGQLDGKDNSSIKYGLTLDATEVPNKGSYRINFDFRQEPPVVVSLERVIENKWTVATTQPLVDLVNALIALHLNNEFTHADIKSNNYLYIHIFEVIKANKFAHMEDLNKELDAINGAANPKLSETKWRQNYMYFFLMNYKAESLRDPDYPEKLDAAMKHWQFNVASFNRDVDVFDDADPLKPILFTVPAMIGREDIVDLKRIGKSMYQVIDDAKFTSQLNPHGGQIELAEGLSQVITPRTTQYRAQERQQLEMWDGIRARYGIPPVLKPKPTTTAPTVSTPSGGSDGFDDNDFADD